MTDSNDPNSTQLRHRYRPSLLFHGPGRSKAWDKQLLSAIRFIVSERRENLNLSKLDGITVTFDLKAALTEIAGHNDLVIARKKQTPSQSYSVTAGCVFGVMRGER